MFQPRTDLALEARELHGESALPGVTSEEATLEGFPLTTVHVQAGEGARRLGKPPGIYHTLDLTGMEYRERGAWTRAVRALRGLLRPLLPEEGCILVAGLGNRAITPDAVGPLAADRTLATRHLVGLVPEHFGDLRAVAVLAAGVLGATGVESGELVKAVAEKISATAVVAVDALAARRLERLCTAVQVSDTGIFPGSGVGNHRFALTGETLGAPVIAVGTPTVVDGATLCMDLLEEAGYSGPGSEVLQKAPGASLIVTPRDIDQRVQDMARVIGYAISGALQPELSLEELEELLG